jgi:hypothetical protein
MMFNTDKPTLDELPTTRQLLKSTALAVASAVVLLFAVVLPAEYGVDITGAGRALGLTEMGEIKAELEDELKSDAENHSSIATPSLLKRLLTFELVTSARAADLWRDELTFTLTPGAYKEVKLKLSSGGSVVFNWEGQGGRVNYDLHAHGDGQSVTYEKGRGKTGGEGGFTAPFPGNHGWFWRNRDREDITITLQLRGDYEALVAD